MCSHEVEFTVAKHMVGFMSVAMDGCIFIWIGNRNRLDTLCFAQNFRGMNLIESAKPNYLTDNFAIKLNKLFPNKQVCLISNMRSSEKFNINFSPKSISFELRNIKFIMF